MKIIANIGMASLRGMPSLNSYMQERADNYDLIIASSPEEFSAGRFLFTEYANSLGFDLCFQNFDRELNEIAIQYNKPDDGLILVRCDKNYIGCTGIRRFEEGMAELKRMYVQPQHRKAGLGKILLEKAIDITRQLGYKKMRLDTLRTMHTAIHLYRKFGFYEIYPYRYNPIGEALYFEKSL